jgi:hypothetical protein
MGLATEAQMRKWAIALCWLAGWMWSGASAQSWVVFIPAERDFRALFPEPPARSAEADGAVAFKASFDDVQYIVFRHDARRLRDVDLRSRIIQRLEAGGDTVQQVTDEDGNSDPAEYVFRRGGVSSVHRIYARRGRYYELVVQSARSAFAGARQTARDFFGSFQMTVGVPSIRMRRGLTLDALCTGRTNAYSRAFCEYAVCLQPDYEHYPHCARLLAR